MYFSKGTHLLLLHHCQTKVIIRSTVFLRSLESLENNDNFLPPGPVPLI